jgi:hypothetical protein
VRCGALVGENPTVLTFKEFLESALEWSDKSAIDPDRRMERGILAKTNDFYARGIDTPLSGMYLHCNYIALAFYERGLCPKWTLIGTIRHLNGMVL